LAAVRIQKASLTNKKTTRLPMAADGLTLKQPVEKIGIIA